MAAPSYSPKEAGFSEAKPLLSKKLYFFISEHIQNPSWPLPVSHPLHHPGMPFCMDGPLLTSSKAIQLTLSLIIIIPRRRPSQINEIFSLNSGLQVGDLTGWEEVRWGCLWDIGNHKRTPWGCSTKAHLVVFKIIFINFRSGRIPFYFICMKKLSLINHLEVPELPWSFILYIVPFAFLPVCILAY